MGLTDWLAAFYREHGYFPNQDPNLLARGYSPEQAMAEHIRAREEVEARARTAWPVSYRQRWMRSHPWEKVPGRDMALPTLSPLPTLRQWEGTYISPRARYKNWYDLIYRTR